MTFSPVLHEPSRAGIRMNDCSTKNVSPAIWCFIFFIYVAAWTALPLHPIDEYRVVCSEEKLKAGPVSQAGAGPVVI